MLAEMFKREPIFRGDSEVDVMTSIFKVLGTPNETNMPGIQELLFDNTLPEYEGEDLDILLNCKDELFIDLLKGLLKYDFNTRMTANDALRHVSR